MRSGTARSRADADELRDGQLKQLRAGLAGVLETNPFWRARLHDVRSWDDFERLPLTGKAELLADQNAHPPFGTNLTYPMERYVRLHQTSGSSGDHPLRWLDTADSWDWWVRVWSDHVYRAAGVHPGDRVQRGQALMRHCVTGKRRARTNPRAVRQPVRKWPRLMKTASVEGPVQFTVV